MPILFVQVYGNDQAFKAYAETHKDCVFLVDTYVIPFVLGYPAAIQKVKWERRSI